MGHRDNEAVVDIVRLPDGRTYWCSNIDPVSYHIPDEGALNALRTRLTARDVPWTEVNSDTLAGAGYGPEMLHLYSGVPIDGGKTIVSLKDLLVATFDRVTNIFSRP